MIESNIIKRFIVKSFMQNNESEIKKVSRRIFDDLNSRFLINESVVVPSLNLTGRIAKSIKPVYKVITTDGKEMDLNFDELKRKNKAQLEDIAYFLECITKVTPLGRLVIENVFEKINQPGFGGRGEPKAVEKVQGTLPKSAFVGPKGKDVNFPPKKFSAVPDKMGIPMKLAKNTGQKISSLEFNSLRRLTVPGLDDQMASKLIYIFLFFDTFGSHFNFQVNSIEELNNAICDPECSNPTLMTIHKFLIETVEREIRLHGNRFYSDVDLLFKTIPELVEEIQPTQNKKRTSMDLDNWKHQTKIFLANVSRDLDSERILYFYEFTRKDNYEVRIDFIVFLIKIAYYSEAVRDFVAGDIQSLRAEKQMVEQIGHLKRKSLPEHERDLKALTEEFKAAYPRNIRSSARTNIGCYKNYLLLLIGGDLILKNNEKYYILETSDTEGIIGDLNLMNKKERVTCHNLKDVLTVMSVV